MLCEPSIFAPIGGGGGGFLPAAVLFNGHCALGGGGGGAPPVFIMLPGPRGIVFVGVVGPLPPFIVGVPGRILPGGAPSYGGGAGGFQLRGVIGFIPHNQPGGGGG